MSMNPVSSIPEPVTVAKDSKRRGSKTGRKKEKVELAKVAKPISRNQLVWRRLRKKPQFWIGGGILLVIILVAIFGNTFNIWGPNDQDFSAFSEPPSSQHWFGTDSIGQDLFARLVIGLRKSLLIGLVSGPAIAILAGLIGSLAGYVGGKVETGINWIISLMLTIPAFYILMIVSPMIKGADWVVLVFFIAGFGWMVTAQIVKNQTKSLKEREFVKAARYMGVGTFRTMLRHIIPNVASLLIIDAGLSVSSAILAETSLSFFGLGIQPPDSSLGTLLSDGQSAATTRPWLFVFPAAFLILLLTAVNIMGDALRDAIDPTSEVDRA